ncbi:MAG: ATP-binding protein [Euryarchaeota archaeon]|nr:ATP-binding protein [Euryarchaeota archaeon]
MTASVNSGNDTTIFDLMEILITADIFNQYQNLNKNDIPPKYRKLFGVSGSNPEIKRDIVINEGILSREMDIKNAYEILRSNPFVEMDEFGQRLYITAIGPAAQWFINKTGHERISGNPALAYYYEQAGTEGISYSEVRERTPEFEESGDYLEAKINEIIGDDEEMQAARDLIIISAPEEIEFSINDLVCTEGQENTLNKIKVAKGHLDYLNERHIYEFGKLLFVGPPGTGKTSLALAMSGALRMPMLEVRLAMVTSQYLGETAKNIDRIFEIARKLAPCILFIDEFDYVARSRVTEDNSAMKRAVNMILKNIDTVSFVKNGVLLIGATNHPQILDEAAWRRFDDVVEFELPDPEMREQILKKITSLMECNIDFKNLAGRTEGFSGADLRILIKESIISVLMRQDHDYCISEEDVNSGLSIVAKRNEIRHNGR